MELVLGAVAARGPLRTQRLDPEHVGTVGGEIINLDGAFFQNQDCVGGDISLAIVVLKGWNGNRGGIRSSFLRSARTTVLTSSTGRRMKEGLKLGLTFLRYMSS